MRYFLLVSLCAFLFFTQGCRRGSDLPDQNAAITTDPQPKNTPDVVVVNPPPVYPPLQREPWIDSPTEKWPKIRLSQKAILKGKRDLTGGNGFLIRSADGRIFGATARHLVEIPGTIADLGNELVSWTLSDRFGSMEKIDMGKPYAALRDIVLVDEPRDTTGLPFQVLDVRRTPVKLDEAVWLIGFEREGGKEGRIVHAGKVTSIAADDSFQFSVEPPLPVLGHSGAPILDADGHALGVFLGSDAKADAQGNFKVCTSQTLQPFFDESFWQRKVSLTKSAAAHVKKILAQAEGRFLRVTVKAQPDDGVETQIDFDDAAQKGDVRFDDQGVPVVIDQSSQLFTTAVTIDFDEAGMKFSVNNPKSWRRPPQ